MQSLALPASERQANVRLKIANRLDMKRPPAKAV